MANCKLSWNTEQFQHLHPVLTNFCFAGLGQYRLQGSRFHKIRTAKAGAVYISSSGSESFYLMVHFPRRHSHSNPWTELCFIVIIIPPSRATTIYWSASVINFEKYINVSAYQVSILIISMCICKYLHWRFFFKYINIAVHRCLPSNSIRRKIVYATWL